MSGPLSKSLIVCSPLNITEEGMVTNKQGIGSILGSDAETPAAASLRRTLSADMSSKKWLNQHGLSLLKKIASSQEFPPPSIIDSSSEEAEEDCEAPGQTDIWTLIQQEKNKKKQLEKPAQFDIWSSIISQKAEEESSKSVPVPYVHPLVKRSASSLSEKSLEICTESLGSETGSDCFSSYPPSETSDMQEDDPKEDDQQLQHIEQERVEELRIVKHYNYDAGKKSAHHHRSFPPPIPSLSRKDGASLRMKTCRDNGRLVLEAVSVPSHDNFVAQRQDGRLVLTFSNTAPDVEEENEQGEFEGIGDEEKTNTDEGVEEGGCCEMEQAPKLSIGAMNVHRLAVMINKPIWLANRNPTWPKNFDDIVKFGEEKEADKVDPTTISPSPQTPPLVQSLPPRPPRTASRLIASPAAAAASFNAYEYYWRRSNQPMSKAAILSKNLMAHNNDQQELLVLIRNKGDYFVPLLKGCKEPRRSLLFWEPYCIATS
ncbi:hypothetical protein J1N35_001923 [Gossypium stocksii]|uniref:FAF domain-containing protein n=1 Tax=Gossypium stocksii TaxID=47602 RepID=A0A9D4AK22_9ROSI|nr:hypothetical protein J1N35_001923 [Gossypium stocksii]